MKKTLLISCLLVASGSAIAQEWPAIQPEARPGARWWWLGSAVDAKNITYNLEEYAKAGLGAVDYVCIFSEKTPCDVIGKIKPDVVIKGGDYKGKYGKRIFPFRHRQNSLLCRGLFTFYPCNALLNSNVRQRAKQKPCNSGRQKCPQGIFKRYGP